MFSPMFCNLNLFELWLFLVSDCCFVYFLTIFVFFRVGQMIMLNGDLDKIWTFYKKKLIRHQLLVFNSKCNVFLKIFYPPSVWVFGLVQKMQQSIKFWLFLNEGDQTISKFCFLCSLYCFCNKYFSAGLQYLMGTTFLLHYSPLLPILSKFKNKL